MSLRTLSEAPLQVAPALVGTPLASPVRRGVALLVDLVLLLIPSIAVAVGAAAAALSVNEPQVLSGMRVLLRHNPGDEAAFAAAVKSVLPTLGRHEARGLPAAARVALEEGHVDEAYEAVRDYDYLFVLEFGEFERPQPPAKTIVINIGDLIPGSIRILALYGVAAAYFTRFSTGKKGATLGKTLAGIRVVRLDGHRLSFTESLERFIGYIHIPAMLGIPILDLWRDPNRRMPHDRTVHTAVVRARSGRR